MNHKPSFFERLTGSHTTPEGEAYDNVTEEKDSLEGTEESRLPQEEEAQLTVDMYQEPDEIIIQAMVSGVKPDDLDISITQDMVTLRGKRSRQHQTSDDDFYYRELYWGMFSRSILLPQEVDAEEATATMKHGMLTIRLPKLDRAKVQKLKVKSE